LERRKMTQSMVQEKSVRDRAHQIFGKVKGFAKEANEFEMVLFTNTGEYLRFGNNELGQSQYTTSNTLSVRTAVGKKHARSTTGRLEDSQIEQAVHKALSQAKSGEEDPDYLPMLGPQKYQSVERWHERTVQAPAEEKAAGIGYAIDLAKKNGLLASGVLGTNADHAVMMNSAGLEAQYRGTTGYYSLTMDADNGNQTGFSLSSFADIRELDTHKVAETALQRAKLNKNQGDVSPGKYDVVIDPNAWTEVPFFLAVSASAGYTPDFGMRQYKEGRSYLSGRMGEKLLGDNITVEDDAYNPLQTGPVFDGEGYPKSKVSLIENGVLRNLASSRISAHKYSDAKPTGQELALPNPLGELPGNLVIKGKGTTKTTEELIGELDKGLFLTRFWYVREVEGRTKTLTGMTRDGTFLVENGEIKRPVKNLRFNQSLLGLLSNVEGFTEPVRNLAAFDRNAVVQPGVLARDFNFSSVSVF
jgi:predicted Zn-dependent protease